MGDGRNHNFEIQTRQKDDELFSLETALGDGVSVTLPIRLVQGYGTIKILASSDLSFRVRVEEACHPEGPWTETSRTTSAVDGAGAREHICLSIAPCGIYMRLSADNLGGGGSTSMDLCGLGHPVAGGGAAGGGGGGGTATVVELEDGGGGLTRASVKTDGTAIGAQGSVLVGAEDPAGAQQSLQVDDNGNLLVTPADVEPGTVITDESDVAVGIGAVVPLAVPPAGTRRMSINVTDGDSTTLIRVRAVGSPAGSGRQLVVRGSTMYGGVDGAIAPLEVENENGPASAVHIDFEIG